MKHLLVCNCIFSAWLIVKKKDFFVAQMHDTYAFLLKLQEGLLLIVGLSRHLKSGLSNQYLSI